MIRDLEISPELRSFVKLRLFVPKERSPLVSGATPGHPISTFADTDGIAPSSLRAVLAFDCAYSDALPTKIRIALCKLDRVKEENMKASFLYCLIVSLRQLAVTVNRQDMPYWGKFLIWA
ncbi:MAG: hypothetical protein WDN23_06160 [Edaphobacter sp.]